MFIAFDAGRCVAAAGLLFSLTESKIMGRMRLLKLLYLANRKSLHETGDPIVDDDVVAMKNGPVLSHTYNLIKGVDVDSAAQALWNTHFRAIDNVQVQMVEGPDAGELSDYDVETLTSVAREYAEWEDEEISELTHTFPEYKQNWDGSSRSARISESDLLAGAGRSSASIREIIDEARIFAVEQALF